MKKFKEIKTKTVEKEVKKIVGVKGCPLAMRRWGLEFVYKTEIVEKEIPLLTLGNLKATIYNLALLIALKVKGEVA